MTEPRRSTSGGKASPGSMTMAMQAVDPGPSGPKVLRVGLIQDGKIVEERVMRHHEAVTIGAVEDNHFLVAEVPGRFPLFERADGGYRLCFTSAMTGRVGMETGVHLLEDLRTAGVAVRVAEDVWQLPISESARGKVEVGSSQLLFQFVPPPPVTPKAQLPAAARGGFAKSIDWLFTAFVVVSYMLFFGLVIYLENADWEIESGIDGVPEQIASLIFEEPIEPPEMEEEEEAEVTEEESETPQTESESSSRPSRESEGPEGERGDPNTSADARARIAEEAASQVEAMMLGANSAISGALANVLAGGADLGSAADILEQAAGGVGIASGSAGELRVRTGGGTGSGQGGDLESLRASEAAGRAASEGQQLAERRVSGRVSLQAGGDIGGSGEFDASLVVRQIRTRQSAIQRCYEQELRRDPTLAGKVTVQFTIEESGNVTGVRATENSTANDALAGCITGTISRFRFSPGPEGGSVTFSYPFVFAPQN